MNKIIEIDGVKYELVKVEEQPQEPQTLHDLIVEWVDDDNTPPVKDLIEKIEEWIPKEIKYKAMGIAKQEWIDGYNDYRRELIEKLK